MHVKRAAPAFDLNNSLGFLLNRVAYLSRQAAQDVFRAGGHPVTAEEWVLLNRLWEQDGQRPSDLADSMIRDRTTVTRLLDGMVRKGLVRRKSDPKDRRVVCAWLTAKGRGLQHELVPLALHLIQTALAGVPLADIEATRRTLLKARENLLELKGGRK
jgi:DNA-binding MarR family transcriptional regulator